MNSKCLGAFKERIEFFAVLYVRFYTNQCINMMMMLFVRSRAIAFAAAIGPIESGNSRLTTIFKWQMFARIFMFMFMFMAVECAIINL